jgi:glutathione-regulated potassium-efflux system ancillary protein KefG
MPKILVLFAHPRLEKSKINRQLLTVIPKTTDITFQDLYEVYPDFNIDVEAEKKLLSNHDIVIFMHPFYWYSCPPLLKQWIDMVLELGWAYGPGGTALKGKWGFNIISTGGTEEVYQQGARNRFTIREFLAPFDQTVHLCGMEYLPPFSIMGTHRFSDEEFALKKLSLGNLFEGLLISKWTLEELKNVEFLQNLVG